MIGRQYLSLVLWVGLVASAQAQVVNEPSRAGKRDSYSSDSEKTVVPSLKAAAPSAASNGPVQSDKSSAYGSQQNRVYLPYPVGIGPAPQQ
jgi:hypothetical protein